MPGPLLVTAALALLSTVAVGAPVSKPSAWLSDADFRAVSRGGGPDATSAQPCHCCRRRRPSAAAPTPLAPRPQHLTIGGTAGLRLGDSAPGSTLVAWHEQFWELVHPHAALDVLVEREHSFAHEAPVCCLAA